MDLIFFHFFIKALIVCSIALLVSFFIYLKIRKHQIIDAFWGLGITSSILFVTKESLLYSDLTKIIYVMIIAWGARLSFLFLYRIKTNHKDQRYQGLVTSSPLRLMIKQSLIQAPLQALIVITIYPLTITQTYSTPFIVLGISIFLIGFLGETIADFQLLKFKKNRSGICNEGLWKFSRHPNYFFESILWLGIALIFLESRYFLIALIGPMSIFSIMYFITGPYTEKCSLKKYEDSFKEYQLKTSYFFPWKQK